MFSPDGGYLYDGEGVTYEYSYYYRNAVPFSYVFQTEEIVFGGKGFTHYESMDIRILSDTHDRHEYINGRLFYPVGNAPYIFTLWFYDHNPYMNHPFSIETVNAVFNALRKRVYGVEKDTVIFADESKVIYFDEIHHEDFKPNSSSERLNALRVGSEWTPNGRSMHIPMAKYHALTRIGDSREVNGNVLNENYDLGDFKSKAFSPDGGLLVNVGNGKNEEWEYSYVDEAYPFIYFFDEDEIFVGECGKAHMHDSTLRELYYDNLENGNFIEGRLFIGNKEAPNVVSTWCYPVSSRNNYEFSEGMAKSILRCLNDWFPVITANNTIFAHWDMIIRLDDGRDAFEPKSDYERLNFIGIGSEKKDNLPKGMTKAQYHQMSTIGDNRKIDGKMVNETEYKMTFNPDNLLSEEEHMKTKKVANKDDVKKIFWKELKKISKK